MEGKENEWNWGTMIWNFQRIKKYVKTKEMKESKVILSMNRWSFQLC